MEQKQIKNNLQLDQLDDEVVEVNHASVSSYPEVLKLPSGENLKCCKVALILQYHNPSQYKDLEGYARHLIFIFYPLGFLFAAGE